MQFELLRERIKQDKNGLIKGISLIVLVELILVLFFFLPASIKEQLVLHKGYTNFIDLLGNHFVHENTGHLLFNMIGYLIVSSMFFLVTFVCGSMKLFYRIFLLNLTVVPLIVSLIWMPVNANIWTISERTLGFSSIGASFMGSVVVAYFFDYLRLNRINRILMSVFLPISLLLLFGYIYLKNIILATLIIPLVAIYAFSAFKSVPNKLWLKGTKQTILTSVLYILPFIFVILFSWSLFPRSIVTENGVVGVYNHFSGFLVGIVAAFVAYEYLCNNKLKKSFSERLKGVL